MSLVLPARHGEEEEEGLVLGHQVHLNRGDNSDKTSGERIFTNLRFCQDLLSFYLDWEILHQVLTELS